MKKMSVYLTDGEVRRLRMLARNPRRASVAEAFDREAGRIVIPAPVTAEIGHLVR